MEKNTIYCVIILSVMSLKVLLVTRRTRGRQWASGVIKGHRKT